MDRREKLLFKDETTQKPRKSHRNTPSFSSTLLDQIYRSIDDVGNPEPPADHVRPRSDVEKRMEKGIINSKPVRRSSILPECDSVMFTCNSNSNSSFSDMSSEFTFGPQTKPCNNKVTCFSTRPKPVRTKIEHHDDDNDDYDSIKSRSTALKLYASLKKMKQPISPGGKLTGFINSLFANKSKKNQGFKEGVQSEPPSSTCSSISRLQSKCTRQRMMMMIRSTGDQQPQQRTVRFHPVGVMVDQDSKPACGHKSMYMSEDCGYNYKRPPLPPKIRASAGYHNAMLSRQQWTDEEDEDAMSESSSDLFEIDHLGLFGSRRLMSEELPVYETTYFDHQKNCGLVR